MSETLIRLPDSEECDLARWFSRSGAVSDYKTYQTETHAQILRLSNSIRDAAIYAEPTPYIYLQDVFRWDFYQALVNSVENCSDYIDLSRIPWWQGDGEHYALRMEELTRAIKNTSMYEVKNNLIALAVLIGAVNNIIAGALVQKFSRWIPEVADGTPSNLAADSFYMRDRSGYGIRPHTESLQTVVVGMLYLPRDHSISGSGTAILRPKDPSKRCLGIGNPLYPDDEFEVETELEFKPNSFMAFVKTPTSWHSLPALPELPYDRNTLTMSASNPERLADSSYKERLFKGETLAMNWSNGL